jgi:hypothetical protein
MLKEIARIVSDFAYYKKAQRSCEATFYRRGEISIEKVI